jgi:hypothetical protein
MCAVTTLTFLLLAKPLAQCTPVYFTTPVCTMYRTVTAGALVFVIYFFQNLLLTCNGQLGDDNRVRLQLDLDKATGEFHLLVERLSNKARLSCYLRTPANSQPFWQMSFLNNGRIAFKVDEEITGYVQCSYEQDGEVKATTEKFTKRPKTFVAVIRLNRNLTLQELQNIKGIRNFKDVQTISADPFFFHVQMDVYVVNPPEDFAELNILRGNIKKYISTRMNITSTRYCPPVPELNITVGYYHPSKEYTVKVRRRFFRRCPLERETNSRKPKQIASFGISKFKIDHH